MNFVWKEFYIVSWIKTAEGVYRSRGEAGSLHLVSVQLETNSNYPHSRVLVHTNITFKKQLTKHVG